MVNSPELNANALSFLFTSDCCKTKRPPATFFDASCMSQPEKGGRKPGSPEFAGVCRSIPRSILAPEHLAKMLARVENRSQLVK